MKEIFDEKYKACKTQMEEVDAPSSSSCYGLYRSFHCSHCGTYLHYYDSTCEKLDISDSDWIIPELAKKFGKERKTQ